MSSFFDQQLIEQLKAAIDSSDLKLLQVLLDVKHLQLPGYWLANAILSYKVTGVIQTLKYQLPINIIAIQKQILDKNFADLIGCCDDVDIVIGDSAVIKKVNKELEAVEQKILQKYKNFQHEVVENEYQVFNVQDMCDANNIPYSYHSDDYTGGNKCVRGFTEEFQNDLCLQPVLKLDVSHNYKKIYGEMCVKIKKQYQLRIRNGQSISSLHQSLTKKLNELTGSDNKLRSILTNISKEIVSRVQNNEFVKKVYDKLIKNVLRIAYKTINHPLHKEFDDIEGGLEKKFKIKRERIREYVIKNSRYELIKDCMEYAASKNKPSLHVISVLIVNGASLLASYVIDAQTQKSITVKEKLQQLGGEYNALIDKSIFTIIRKVHKLIFDFPMIGKEGIDLLKVVSEIPSEKGCFVESAEDLILFNKIGDEGKREFLSLLQTCINDCDFSKFRHRLSLLSSESVSKKEREHAYVILNECVKVGYLAIATGDDRVIIDYLLEIKEESKQSKNPYLKKLYEKFFEILSDYDDLPKSMFLSRCFRYIVRTVKSYSGYEWNPAWEKIFTGPGYRTDVGEWSKNNYEEIIKAKDKRSTKRIEELAEGRRKAEQKAEQIRNVSGIFTREILKLDEEELRDIVADSQEKVVERVVKESNTAPKKLLQAIIEEIKWKRNQVLAEGEVSNEVIEAGIKIFDSTLLSNVNVNQLGMCMSRR